MLLLFCQICINISFFNKKNDICSLIVLKKTFHKMFFFLICEWIRIKDNQRILVTYCPVVPQLAVMKLTGPKANLIHIGLSDNSGQISFV